MLLHMHARFICVCVRASAHRSDTCVQEHRLILYCTIMWNTHTLSHARLSHTELRAFRSIASTMHVTSLISGKHPTNWSARNMYTWSASLTTWAGIRRVHSNCYTMTHSNAERVVMVCWAIWFACSPRRRRLWPLRWMPVMHLRNLCLCLLLVFMYAGVRWIFLWLRVILHVCIVRAVGNMGKNAQENLQKEVTAALVYTLSTDGHSLALHQAASVRMYIRVCKSVDRWYCEYSERAVLCKYMW